VPATVAAQLEVPLTGTLFGVQETATEVTAAAPLAGVVKDAFAFTVAPPEDAMLQSRRK
jgi:hypothetical protein